MSLREAYKQKFSAQVDEQKARLGALKARAKRVVADTRIVGYEELGKAEQGLNRLATKLKRVAGASLQALQEVKGGVGKAVDDLTVSTKRAAARLSEAQDKPARAKARRTTTRKAPFKASPKARSIPRATTTRQARRKGA